MLKNSLATVRPDLAAQWHSTKNGVLLPSDVSYGSKKKIWWECDKGHEWDSSPLSRSKNDKPVCLVCSGKRRVVGVNDFGTTHSVLATEWHPSYNGTVKPSDFTYGSHQKVWWLGKCGHEWEATILNRSSGNGCYQCLGRKKSSPQGLLKSDSEVMKSFHPSKNFDLNLDTIKRFSLKRIWWICDKGHEWEATASSRSTGYGCPVCSGNLLLSGFNDAATVYPSLVEFWSDENKVSLDKVAYGSNQKYWWSGECDHEWLASVSGRVRFGCAVCAGKQIQSGVNDLSSLFPKIAAEWHPIKNNILAATQVSAYSRRKVWWLGECGHEWDAPIGNRTGLSSGCPVCVNKQIIPNYNDLLLAYPSIASKWHPTKNGVLKPNQVAPKSFKKVWWLCENGHEWKSSVADRSRVRGERDGVSIYSGCPKCAVRVSRGEQQIFEYIEKLKLEVVQSSRKVISPFELDIFIPSKNFAIEYNGLYWHSEVWMKTKTYHYDKWKACKDKGIQLIQVWEDDWNRNPELVKRMLAHKLGVTGEPKVYARKTKIKTLTQQEVDAFLAQNHIQGAVQGSVRLGLTVIDTQTGVENSSPVERLVAVMVLKKEPGTEGGTLNLLRFATSQPVVGGFTKLLKQAEQIENVDKIVTFSDNTVSDGELYESTGFIADKELKPDYMYVVKGNRVHKFNFRLKRFRDDPGLKYEEGLTERELAALNGLHRIWDAGKIRWIKLVS